MTPNGGSHGKPHPTTKILSHARRRGFLGANSPQVQARWTAAFVQRLQELGWIEGRNIAIEYRWAEGRFDRSPELVAELIRLKVDVIVTHSPSLIVAAKRATSDIPIVFAAVADPVSICVVDSLARPGGNVTGLSNQFPDAAGKRVELVREVVPSLHQLAILANVGMPLPLWRSARLRQR